MKINITNINKYNFRGSAGVHMDSDTSFEIFVSQFMPKPLYDFCLQHELGHVFCDHFKGRKDIPYLQQEIEADKYAIEHGGDLSAFLVYLQDLIDLNFFNDFYKRRNLQRIQILSGKGELPRYTHRCLSCGEYLEKDELIYEDAWTPTCPSCYGDDMIKELENE